MFAVRLIFLAAAEFATSAAPAAAGEVLAGSPSKVAVTVYRAPQRSQGTMNLDALQGFALITETRAVQLPAGESQLRFEGVANGVDAASALLGGLPATLLEKNQDARLLDPSTLARAAAGIPLQLVRTDRATGRVTRTQVELIAASEAGVVFNSAAGVEAYHCDGLSETFAYSSAAGLSAAPTLSVLVRAEHPFSAQVTLSYLSRGFDWYAQYSAALSTDATRMDMGAWVTLANSNDVGFSAASTQVVAGRVNRDTAAIDPIDMGPPTIAACWPQETTSDLPLPPPTPVKPAGKALLMRALPMPVGAADLQEVVVTKTVAVEQLGDLKLYRVPEPTVVAAPQSKQVRLLDRTAIPVKVVYSTELYEWSSDEESVPMQRVLRTKNLSGNHLGLALPSGSIAVFERVHGGSVLLSEAPLRDTAVGEDLEIEAGESADVRIKTVTEERRAGRKQTPLARMRVEISNARVSAARIEIKIILGDGERILDADHPLGTRDGRPAFMFSVPSGATETLRFARKSP